MSFLVLDICISELLNIGYRTWAMYVIFKHFLKLHILLNNCMFNFCTEVKNHIIILYRIVFESSFCLIFISFARTLWFTTQFYVLFVLPYLVETLIFLLMVDINMFDLWSEYNNIIFCFSQNICPVLYLWNGDISKAPA